MKHFCLFDQTFLWLAAALLTSCSELLSQEGRLGASVLQLPALRAGRLKVNHRILWSGYCHQLSALAATAQAEDQKKVRSIRRRAVPGMAGPRRIRNASYGDVFGDVMQYVHEINRSTVVPAAPTMWSSRLVAFCVCDACRLSHAVTLEHLPISLECYRRLFYMNVIDFL